MSSVKLVKLGEPRPSLSAQTYGIRNPPAGDRCSMFDSQAARPANRAQRTANRPAQRNDGRPRPSPAQREPPSMSCSCPGGTQKTARVPRISGQKSWFEYQKTRSAARCPHVRQTGARAMFLTNIYIKFDLRYNYLIKQYIIP